MENHTARNLYIKKKVASWQVQKGSYDSNGIVDTLCTKKSSRIVYFAQ